MLLFSFLSQQQKNRHNTLGLDPYITNTHARPLKAPKQKIKNRGEKKTSWSIVKIKKKEEKNALSRSSSQTKETKKYLSMYTSVKLTFFLVYRRDTEKDLRETVQYVYDQRRLLF
jgi:hypothetical protein